jgi:hypothetical protein
LRPGLPDDLELAAEARELGGEEVAAALAGQAKDVPLPPPSAPRS